MKLLIFFSVLFLHQIVAQLTCGVNERINTCYSPCERTCRTRFRGDGRNCLAVCRLGCSCIDGYMKHDNGTCVPIAECSEPLCYEEETYNRCGSACPVSCSTLGNTCNACTDQCVEGCFCKEGYVQFSPTAVLGGCVPVSDCADRNTCRGDNEVYDACPDQCTPKTCDELLDIDRPECTPSDCCAPSCQCIEGYYRDRFGVCVINTECLEF